MLAARAGRTSACADRARTTGRDGGLVLGSRRARRSADGGLERVVRRGRFGSRGVVMVSQVNEHLGTPTEHIVEWTRAFVRHPSPQTERFEHEPQVQSFIGERVVPLVQELGLPWRRDAMGNLLV